MARIFEALKHTDARRRSAVASTSAPASPSRQLDAPARKEPSPEIPYIEVGGPKMEASSSVLQAGTGATRTAVPRSRPKEADVTSTKTSEPSPASEPVILFRPMPDSVSPAPACYRFAPELMAFHHPEHPIARQYAALLASLLAQTGDKESESSAPAIMLSGVAAEAGTTTVLLNLAITFARQGKSRVVVVDAAVPRPAISKRLGLPAAPGLREVLSGAAPLSRVIQPTGQPHLLALTAGDANERTGLAVKSLRAALQRLRKRFDLVLVDAPTWKCGSEMAALAAVCDAFYLVTPHSLADSAAIKDLLASILHQGVCLRGSIQTQR